MAVSAEPSTRGIDAIADLHLVDSCVDIPGAQAQCGACRAGWSHRCARMYFAAISADWPNLKTRIDVWPTGGSSTTIPVRHHRCQRGLRESSATSQMFTPDDGFGKSPGARWRGRPQDCAHLPHGGLCGEERRGRCRQAVAAGWSTLRCSVSRYQDRLRGSGAAVWLRLLGFWRRAIDERL